VLPFASSNFACDESHLLSPNSAAHHAMLGNNHRGRRLRKYTGYFRSKTSFEHRKKSKFQFAGKNAFFSMSFQKKSGFSNFENIRE
jgi:hypothetical protein